MKTFKRILSVLLAVLLTAAAFPPAAFAAAMTSEELPFVTMVMINSYSYCAIASSHSFSGHLILALELMESSNSQHLSPEMLGVETVSSH